MTRNAISCHAGCGHCVGAETALARALDPASLSIEIVHPYEDRAHVPEAVAAGVVSVPALVIDGQAFHNNFCASPADLRGGVARSAICPFPPALCCWSAAHWPRAATTIRAASGTLRATLCPSILFMLRSTFEGRMAPVHMAGSVRAGESRPTPTGA